jgi:hypothetical protein
MKTINKHHLLALLLALLAVLPMSAALRIPSYDKRVARNSDFTVLVRQGGEAWQQVPVLAWKVDHVTGGRHHTETTSVAALSFSGKMEVAIVKSGSRGKAWRVRPLSYAVPSEQRGDTLFFSLDHARYFSVEVDGDLYHNLQLFADDMHIPVCRNAAEVAKAYKVKKKDVVFFAPGYHELSDSLGVKSGQVVYLSAGAYVKGWLSAYGAHDVKIVGTGVINPERQHEGIMVRYAKNVLVDGPLTTQLPVGGSDGVTVRNAKVMSWYGWGDGFNIFASSNIVEEHLFARTSDDCSTIYCTRKGYQGGCRNIRVSDCVYWADVAHPIMIGLHGDIEKNETITDVVYDNIDILQQNERQIDYQGCIAINNGDNILVDGISFSNIRIEDISLGNLFNFRVCYNKKYCHAPGRGIRNITLRNISYNGTHAGMSILTGYDENRRIDNIRFENLQINGQKVYDKMPGKPGWYKTSDFANMFIGEHVGAVIFSE